MCCQQEVHVELPHWGPDIFMLKTSLFGRARSLGVKESNAGQKHELVDCVFRVESLWPNFSLGFYRSRITRVNTAAGLGLCAGRLCRGHSVSLSCFGGECFGKCCHRGSLEFFKGSMGVEDSPWNMQKCSIAKSLQIPSIFCHIFGRKQAGPQKTGPDPPPPNSAEPLAGKKKAHTALHQWGSFLCRKKWGPQRKDFGGGYGFPGFYSFFASTTGLESFSLRPEKFSKRFSFGGGSVCFFLLCLGFCRRVLRKGLHSRKPCWGTLTQNHTGSGEVWESSPVCQTLQILLLIFQGRSSKK